MVEGLIEGKEYVLREDQAPLGYDIAESIRFTVGEDNEVVMVDNHLPEEKTTEDDNPDTGDGSMLRIIIAAAVMCTAGMCAAAAFRRREE